MKNAPFLRFLSIALTVCISLPSAYGHDPVYARKGMVVAQEPLAADVGVTVLKLGGNAVDGAVWLQLIQLSSNRLTGQLEIVAMANNGTVNQTNLSLSGGVDASNIILSGTVMGPPNIFSTPEVLTLTLSGILNGDRLTLIGGPTQMALSTRSELPGVVSRTVISEVLVRSNLKEYQTIVNAVHNRADWLARRENR